MFRSETSVKQENGELINISQFSIAPKKQSISFSTSASNHSKKSIASIGFDQSHRFNRKSLAVNMNDPFYYEYMNETAPWRLVRENMTLPALPPKNDRFSYNSSQMYDAYVVLKKIQTGVKDDSTIIDYEPTYRLEPVKKLDRNKAQMIMQNVVRNISQNMLTIETMKSESSLKASIDHLITTIKSQVKLIADKRYKLIVNATICEQKYQGIMIASKCLWDSENDISITVKQNFKNYVIVVSLYAIYKE